MHLQMGEGKIALSEAVYGDLLFPDMSVLIYLQEVDTCL